VTSTEPQTFDIVLHLHKKMASDALCLKLLYGHFGLGQVDIGPSCDFYPSKPTLKRSHNQIKQQNCWCALRKILLLILFVYIKKETCSENIY